MKFKIYEDIKQNILNCNKCDLCEEGKLDNLKAQVAGQGNLNSKFLFIAQNPGAEEIKNQQPLTGTSKSGKLYNKILQHIELSREDVYTTNVVACHSPNNREPELYEVDKCNEHLDAQIRLIKPKLIITFGRFAAQNFINNFKITRDHGIVQHNDKYDANIFPMYHPAFVSCYAPASVKLHFKEDLDKLKKIVKEYK